MGFARTILAALALALLPAQAQARFGIPGFELVHNAPAETSLATPDLRDPVTVWCEMFDHAKRTIDLEQYYIAGQPGEPLDTVIACLNAAAKRGVHIRFLMEKKGLSASDTPTIDRVKAIPNIEFRMLAWADINKTGIIHAKFFVVDGMAAFVGSQNFDWRALKHIDETGLAITQPTIVGQMQRIFDHDWKAQALVDAHQPVPELRTAEFAPVAGTAFLVASPNDFDLPGIPDSQAALVKLIGEAKREIRIEVMEYSTLQFGTAAPYAVIDDALRAAAKRGVKVRLAIADWDMIAAKMPGLQSLSEVPNVEIKVVAIPPASTGFIPYARVIHTKIMAIDGEIAWVGTSNWEGGYLDNSRNLEVVLRDRKMAERVGAIQAQVWDSKYALPYAIAKSIPRPKTSPN